LSSANDRATSSAFRRQLHDGITDRAESFEEHRAPAGSCDGVVSANAFHWVDLGVAYRHAAFLTGPDRPLALIWTFPELATSAVELALALGNIDRELGRIDQLEKQITHRWPRRQIARSAAADPHRASVLRQSRSRQ
jgi:hypothetical protein